jgi:hypothetical protein
MGGVGGGGERSVAAAATTKVGALMARALLVMSCVARLDDEDMGAGGGVEEAWATSRWRLSNADEVRHLMVRESMNGVVGNLVGDRCLVPMQSTRCLIDFIGLQSSGSLQADFIVVICAIQCPDRIHPCFSLCFSSVLAVASLESDCEKGTTDEHKYPYGRKTDLRTKELGDEQKITIF